MKFDDFLVQQSKSIEPFFTIFWHLRIKFISKYSIKVEAFTPNSIITGFDIFIGDTAQEHLGGRLQLSLGQLQLIKAFLLKWQALWKVQFWRYRKEDMASDCFMQFFQETVTLRIICMRVISSTSTWAENRERM